MVNSDQNGLHQGCQGRGQSGQGTCAAASVSATRALPADSPCARAALACRSPRARRRVRPRGVSSPSESFGASCSPAEAHHLLVTVLFVRESHARQATFLVEFERQWRDYLHQVLRPEEDVIGRDLTAGEVEALSDEQKVQMVRRSGRLERAPVLASKVRSPSRPRLARLTCCVCARVAWQSGSSRFVRTHWAQPRSSYEIRVCMRSKQSTLDRLEPCRGLRCLSRDVGWSHSQQAGEQASPGVRNVLSRLHAGCPRPRIGASDSFWHGVWTLSDTLYSEIECSPRRASTLCLCLPRGPRRN